MTTSNFTTPEATPDALRSDWLAEYPPPRSMPLDQEALRIYEHAYAIGTHAEQPGKPPVTFSTVLAALLVGEDETSRWFAGEAVVNGPDAGDVFSEKSLTRDAVRSFRPRPGRPDSIQLSNDRQLLTASARAVIENAERWAQKVGGSDIGVRHLVASYVINPPPAHGAQMQRWKYQETKWRAEFFGHIAERYTAERWTDVSHLPAPTKAIASFDRQQVKGEALAFPADERMQAVLDEAASFHAHRSDAWLRIRTVFFALIETARKDADVRKEIQPIWDAVEAVGAWYEQSRADFISGAASNPIVPFSGLDLSPRVLNTLAAARELALADRLSSSGGLRVSVLQLAGALVSRRADEDVELASLGLKPRALRVALIEHAQKLGESREVWRDALGEEEIIQAGRPVDLNSDEPEAVVRRDEAWVSDPLGIRRDVETFAALLASKNLEPPLSIGLFGAWGSGKTTFLKRLRRAVERRAGEARESIDSGQPTPYVGNVVHVDFNAWHFAEGALTSSLVDTILRALRSYIEEDGEIAGTALTKLKLEELESTRRKVEAAEALEAAARAAVGKAEGALAKSRQQAAEATTSMRKAVQTVWTATKDALLETGAVKDSGVLEAIGDTVNSTDELRARLEQLRARPARLLTDLGWGRSLLFAALILAVPPLVAWLVQTALQMGQAVQFLSSAMATLSAVALWARSATRAVSRVDWAVKEVAEAYENRIVNDSEVVAAQAAVDAAEASAATAAASLRAAREELARAQAEAANATLPAQMLQLVSSRIDAETYGKELTTLSLARADLERLSVILRGQRSSAVAEKQAGQGSGDASMRRAVDRVILYIDDLDRCKPTDVVRVLQVVHMLLAFELFVVVVAVDARWVEAALRKSYPWLGDSEAPAKDAATDGRDSDAMTGRATPQDYLEKIFQIAFWLEPMTSARAASYLGSLVPAAARESGPVLGAGVTSRPGATGATVPPVTKVVIGGVELDYMRALAAYVGSSPRRVKRLVNAYRLIKAGMSDTQLSTFLTDRAADDGSPRSGPYQIVIGLLVIGTGAPSSSAEILGELAECDPKEDPYVVVERFRARNNPDWNIAGQVIETLARSQKAKSMSEIRGWARKVGRFLLNSPTSDRRLQAGYGEPAALRTETPPP